MSHFRDLPLGTKVSFRLRFTRDLRHPRDAFRLRRRLETRRTLPLGPLTGGPLEPEIIPATDAPRDLYEDDKDSALRDEWRAEEREWVEDFREKCRDL